MTDGPDRRDADTEAARGRRRDQRRRWEASDLPTAEYPTDSFAQALGALLDWGHRLPVCDRSARLHAAVNRLANAPDRNSACADARALAAASEAALSDDPWYRFHRAALEAVGTLCEAE